MIQPGQKLSEGDCVYNLTKEQIQELLMISDDTWIFRSSMDGLVHSKHELFPTYLEYCAELEEHTFPDFKQLCENTFGDGKGV